MFLLLLGIGVLGFAVYTFSLFPAEFPNPTPQATDTPGQVDFLQLVSESNFYETLPQLFGGYNNISFTQVVTDTTTTAGSFPEVDLGQLLYRVPEGRKATTLSILAINSSTVAQGPVVVGLAGDTLPPSMPVFPVISSASVPARSTVPLKAQYVLSPGDVLYFWGNEGLQVRVELAEFDDDPGTPENLVVDVSAQKEIRLNVINENLILLQAQADGTNNQCALPTCHNDTSAANFSWRTESGATESNALVAAPSSTVPHCSVLMTNLPTFAPGFPVTFSSTAASSASLHAVMLTVLRVPEI